MASFGAQDATRNGQAQQDEAGSGRTRTRVSRACTRCRQRKDRCTGEVPTCSNCASADQPCSYDTATKKRGLPEGYVRAVEKLWAVSFARIEGLEKTLLEMLQQDRDSLSSIWNHREMGDELHSRWKDSQVYQELETFLAGVDSAASTGSKRKREKDDEDDHFSSTELNVVLPPKYTIRGVNTQGQTPSSATGRYPRSNITRLPPVASDLLTQYFKTIHFWFPILDRPRTQRLCYEILRDGALAEEDNADLAVLAAALACVSGVSFVAREIPATLDSEGEQFYMIACHCIPRESGSYQAAHIQALLLLALTDMSNGVWESAWQNIGLAVRALGKKPDNGTPTRDQLATRQACLILDVFAGIRTQEKPQFQREHISMDALLREDDHEEWEPWPGSSEPAFAISCFNSLTKLAAILNEFVSHDFVAGRSPSRDRSDEALGNLNRIASTYPPSARLTATSSSPPHQIWLKIVHLMSTAYVTAAHPSMAKSVVPPLATAKRTIESIGKSLPDSLMPMPPWIQGLLSAILVDLTTNSKYRPEASHISLLTSLVERLGSGTVQGLDDLQRQLQTLQKPRQADSGRVLARSADMPPSTTTGRQSQVKPFFPADPFAQPMVSMSNMSPPTSDTALNASAAFANTPQSYWNGNIDIPPGPAGIDGGGMSMNAHRASTGNPTNMYNPSIATSPSFQGDEIDALFHEMAQLDTTEWATGRTQGLRDFGFNDVETFEQFCNDPERLFSDTFTDPQQQVFGHRSMSDLQMPDFISQQGMAPNYSMGSNWNG